MKPHKCNKAMDVMLSLSKYRAQGLAAPTLRQAQGDSALLFVVVILFCLVLSINALAQKQHDNHVDSLNNKSLFEPSHALIVVNGMVYNFDSLKNIKATDIISIDTLKHRGKENTNPNIPDHGAIIIITKEYAVDQYQKKYSTLSSQYASYLAENHANEDDIGFVINGAYIDGKTDERIKVLYELPVEKIKYFKFTKNPLYHEKGSKKYIVVITTKK